MKKVNLFHVPVFLTLVSFITTMASAAPPVAWWKMDDSSGVNAAVADSSGHNRIGTFYSGTSTQNTAIAHSPDRPEGSGSLRFDGVNDYATVTGYKGITSTNSRTCAAWVKTTFASQAAIVAWGSGTSGRSWVFRVESTGQLGVGIAGGSIRTSSSNLLDNAWHHVAAVLFNNSTSNPTVGEVKLYIDGVLQTLAAPSAVAINTESLADVRIGAFTSALNDTPANYFKGLLDDVRIYDYALSVAEILALNTWKPSPRDGAANVSLEADLTWAAQLGALSYNVYFGSDTNAVAIANTEPLTGDISGDQLVNIHDLSILAGQWLTNPGATNQSADLHYNGNVNFGDFTLLAAAWGRTAEFKGNQSGTNYDPGTLAYNKNYYWRIDVFGGLDTTGGTVRVFTTLSDGSVPAVATNPSPADGATNVPTAVTYSWSASPGATSFKVYRKTSLPFTGTPTTVAIPSLTVGNLVNDTTNYWRVDAVNMSGTTTGAVWSFRTELLTSPPGLATNPSPAQGENFVSPYANLAWTAGSNAVSHNVYFGTNNPPPFLGNTTSTTFDPGVLTTNVAYYWRVDEINSVGTTTGTVWSITTEARLRPDQFVILPWDAPWRNFGPYYDVATCNTIRDCGFNLAGFVDPAELDSAAAAGIKAFTWNWNTYPSSSNMVNWPQATIDGYVTQLVNQVSTHSALFGYFLRDEPPLSDFPGLGNWRTSFKAADPDKLVYMSLGWDYDYANYIAQTGQDDFLSYDFYGVLEDGRVYSYYFPVLEKARSASLSSGLPFWNTVSSLDGYSDNPDWNSAPPTPENLRFQLYTSLAYGVKGISWFSYFSQNATAPIQYGLKTAAWYYLQDVNMQMHRIGQTYITLTNNNVFHHPNVPPGQPFMTYPAGSISSSLYVQSISGGDYVVGEFNDPAAKKFIMVVNKSLTTNATINVTFKTAGTIYRVNAATGQLQLFSQGQTLLPGEGMLLKLD